MIASIKLELWYLNTPEMTQLMEREGALVAKGAMLSLFECLRLSHNAVGHRSMLKKVARDNGCDADWLWGIVTRSGLFEYNADETFSSPYFSKTLGIGRSTKSSRVRTRYNARYNDDNNDNEDKENSNTTSACVCLDDTQQPDENGAREQTDYRNYDNYLKR